MADFQAHLAQFEAKGVCVIAASVETEEEARETVAGQGVTYPVGFGLDPEGFAARYGAFHATDDDEPYLHATGFLLRPDGTVDIAVYSTGAIGRLTATDLLSILDYRLSP